MAPTASVEVTATMEAAISMESAATVETLAAVPSVITVEFTATMPSPFTTESIAMPSAVAVKFAVLSFPSFMFVPVAAVESVPSTIVATAVVAMKPGPRSNEYAACKIVRPVVAVRRAGIRVIAVVSISTDRWRSHVDGGNAHSDMHGNLSVSSSRHRDEHPHHDHVF